MNKWLKGIKGIVGLSLIAVLAGCGSTAETDEAKHSGFLSNYDRQVEIPTGDDDLLKTRWVSDAMASGNHTALMIDPIVYFPAPMTSEKVTSEVLAEVLNYTNESIRESAASTGKLVDKPGPGVVRLRLAITGASIDDQGLTALQYLPIAFVASAATGNLDNLAAHLTVEGEVIDSVSGELLSSTVLVGIGKEVDDDEAVLNFDMVKPVIDKWNQEMIEGIGRDLH
ncbi:DUF3313 domain-containing protein [Neiella marina]|uniref:DUF3313 domain-containing protein n=1 Tax=Neiella holothuriorum TaxID=2870530 RepID=A0ABS7EDJ3_9GAMM|nr:DUF3313 domain-containing protein [Neiella holothuriorum]MBW8189881.1 DUF3313 domain-containing protein [Neiella holothuriorum]